MKGQTQTQCRLTTEISLTDEEEDMNKKEKKMEEVIYLVVERDRAPEQ